MEKGHSKVGGRGPAVSNKIPEEVRRLAQNYSRSAIRRLADLIENGESHAVQLAACREILDRGLGKARQEIDITTSGEIREIRVIEIVGQSPVQLQEPAREIDVTPEIEHKESFL